jgi:hypothetical protein
VHLVALNVAGYWLAPDDDPPERVIDARHAAGK